ncbi:glycosyl transferase family 1 [Tenacibaculum holothuriorum]|uniref:Glycosyl transferase family 1 n=1 Tax=Tenacibaculum holothuriorum TaxID=1635173 RepID=A0A1Y2PFU2_9FLAO|nr:glycosyltransferase family 1 protein [Tenacibaculum holothuriorum]OSY89353.1 glycosyl transferase family 1 [Tenacibaculum holothuriorum]
MNIGFDAKRAFHNTTGLGNYSRDLIRILSDFYPDNQYFLYNPKPKTVKRLSLESNMQEILPDKIIWKKLSSYWRQKPIVSQLKKDNLTIFHGLSGELPIKINKAEIKTVVTIHDLIFVRYPELYSFFDRKIHFKKFKHAAKVADKVIAISEQTKRDIIEFLEIKPSKIEVVYQGCHNEFKVEKTVEEKQVVLQKYNLPKEFVLYVGTIERRKNALSLIKAMKNVDVPLVLVGRKTKDYQQEIDAYINEHKLQSKVIFLEKLTLFELSVLYQQTKLFVYPSIFEGFGIPIIEALFSKTPVITSTGSCFSEAGGKHSIYVEPYNVEELNQQIVKVLSDAGLQNRMQEKGLEYAQQFTDENVAKNVFNVYKSLQ